LGGCPFGPFAVGGSGSDTAEPEYLTALRPLGLSEVAGIYAALFLKSGGAMGPRAIDELELWEVAVLLQATYTTDKDSSPKTGKTRSHQGDDDRYRLIRERDAYAKGLGPKPEPRPVDPTVLEALKGAM
jgi:hypothetical protein